MGGYFCKQMAELNIHIDGYIGQGDFFTDGVSLKSIREQVDANKDIDVLNVYINSGGGDVTEGFAIYDYLNTLPLTVNTIAQGIVGSIATVIFQAGKKGKRKMNLHSDFFIHNPYWVPQSPEPMEASQAQALAESLQKAEDKILDFYVSHTSKSADDIKAKMKSQTTFTAKEAVEWGFADEVIETQIENQKKYAVMACVRFTNQKQNTMNIQEELNKFENSLVSKLKNLFAPKIKAEMHQTSEGVQIFFDGELEVGKPVFLDEDMTTPAPDGVHTMDDKKFTIKEGVVESIEEVAAVTSDEKQKEIDALKAQLETANAELQNKTKEVETLQANLDEVKVAANKITEDFQNFKGQFVTGNGELKPEFQNFKGESNEKTLIQKTLELKQSQKK